MPIRITGMNSGLDTESIITALTQTKQDKLDKFKGEQKKLTWKQEKWQELNKKVASFYNGSLGSMRFSTAYTKKTTTVSNANAATVITGNNAMLTNQSLDITSLAKAAYLTGNEVKYTDDSGKQVKAGNDTTMDKLGITDTKTLEFTVGDKTSSIEIKATDKISDVVSKLKKAAGGTHDFSYDANNGRFFVSAKSAGDSGSFSFGGDAAAALGLDSTHYVQGSSAKIKLNGVEYTSDTNTFEVNGLTITANELATGIQLSTKQDTSGIYDNIKNMLKEYNDLMKEFATLYNADKATKYNMLTDEQRESLSETEVEEWDKKIKDGLLSGDETISTLRTALRGIMSEGIDVKLKDGTTQKLSLASFGISTADYFGTDENEREILHIDGDPDDASVKGNTDKLNAMISSDPEATQNFFMQLSKDLYSKLSDLMRGTNYSSSFTIYEDKLMASQYSAYNTKINDAQEALEAAQDKLYKKYSKMETALGKINTNSNSLMSFFGTGSSSQ